MSLAIKAYQDKAGRLTPASAYVTPDGRGVEVMANMAALLMDDFGGAAVNTTTTWNVIDGGLGANPTLNGQSLTQGAIGSGVTGITDSVASSALTVAMGTTNNAERWYLSQQVFAGMEDVTIVTSKSQALTANSIFFGLVEVDPVTLIPLLNPNLAAQFTNMGGVEFGATVGANSYACQAIGDSSGAIATGSTAVALNPLTTTSEFMIEFHAEDIICSNGAVDSVNGKSNAPSRVSTQCPNDGKVYKLLMRFKNVSAPGSNTNVVIQRVLAVLSQEIRAEVTSGRGDNNTQKAIPVNLCGNSVANRLTGGLATTQRLSAATATTGVVKASAGQVYLVDVISTNAAVRYLHLYNKATAPTLNTDTPLMTIGLPANGAKSLSIDAGVAFPAGIAWAVTTDDAAVPVTAGAAGDIQGTIGYA